MIILGVCDFYVTNPLFGMCPTSFGDALDLKPVTVCPVDASLTQGVVGPEDQVLVFIHSQADDVASLLMHHRGASVAVHQQDVCLVADVIGRC